MVIKRIISKLYKSSKREIVNNVTARLWYCKPDHHSADVGKAKEIADELRNQFTIYQTSNLVSMGAEEFKEYIQSKIGVSDAKSEGYLQQELERQRDLSIKFHWGHNHDFGDFQVEGRMGGRHINLLANFTAIFPISLADFKNKEVFDIGCWTGGTTLLLASLGSKVLAIEEVKKYAELVSFLVKSFGLDDRVSVNPISIYDCNSEQFYDRFDIVYFPGVIYHLSDPLVALRILFNSLKVGGTILVESAGINKEAPFCRFDGSLIDCAGTKERLNRGGWNWFIPSPSALYRMMREAGFDEIKTVWHNETKRVYGYGRKVAHVAICRAGLSVRNIR
ncbi:MAG: class I SAM-dependent methyltransferase [Candidatus Binatia bacterium]